MAFELARNPEDAITKLVFSPNESQPNLLLVSSWDSKVRLYDVELNVVKGLQANAAPILDCCFFRDRAVSGGLARDVRIYDFQKDSDTLLGKHGEAIRHVRYNDKVGLIFSGSWDGTVGVWDPRSQNIAHRLQLDAKVFGMCTTPDVIYSASHLPQPSAGPPASYDKLIIGDSLKRVHIYDLRKLNEPEQIKDEIVKYQIRCIEPFADGTGFAVGTTEGRVAYEYFDPSYISASNGGTAVHNVDSYAFKCHRSKMQYEDILQYSNQGMTVSAETDKIFPVNAIAFNAKYNTFATGGGDGGVSFWDGLKKKRLWRLSKPLVTSVTSLAFSVDSSKLAIAASYDWSNPATASENRYINYAQVVIRDVNPEEIRKRA